MKDKALKPTKKSSLIVSIPFSEEQTTECSHECHESSRRSETHHFLDEEFENEIPGGFDAININEHSLGDVDESEDDECYIKLPKLEQYVGPEWEDVEIHSHLSNGQC